MAYCECCGKENLGWLEHFTCRHCGCGLCIECECDHQENCSFKENEVKRELDPKLVKLAQKKLKIPMTLWEGNCYAISCAFIKHKIVKGVPRYGHWRGPVMPSSSFFKSFETMGFVNHGWVEMSDGEICDPTRWVFECVSPYVFKGKDSEEYYDINGNRWYATQHRPVPVANKGDRTISYPKDKEVKKFVVKQLLRTNTKITIRQACWIANTPPDELFPFALEIYLWLKEIGKAALIPIENRLLILKE